MNINPHILKSICFFGLFISGILSFQHVNEEVNITNSMSKPFYIGAGLMSVASLLTYYSNNNSINNNNVTSHNYEYPIMYVYFHFNKNYNIVYQIIRIQS